MRNIWVLLGAAVTGAAAVSKASSVVDASIHAGDAREAPRHEVARILQRGDEGASPYLEEDPDISDEANALLDGEEVTDEFGEVVVPEEERDPENFGFSPEEAEGSVSRRLEEEEGEEGEQVEEKKTPEKDQQEDEAEGSVSRRLSEKEGEQEEEEKTPEKDQQEEEEAEGSVSRRLSEEEGEQEEEEKTPEKDQQEEEEAEGSVSRRLSDEGRKLEGGSEILTDASTSGEAEEEDQKKPAGHSEEVSGDAASSAHPTDE